MKGKFYHDITTLLKKQIWFCVATRWVLSYGKVIKTTRYKKWRWNPNLNAQVEKMIFLPKDLQK
jgi:hypothetical protein